MSAFLAGLFALIAALLAPPPVAHPAAPDPAPAVVEARPAAPRPPAPAAPTAEQLPEEVIGRQVDCPDGQVGRVIDAAGTVECPPHADPRPEPHGDPPPATAAP